MVKFIFPVLLPVLILVALVDHLERREQTAEKGTLLLLPVEAAVSGRDVLSGYIDLRYRVLIPPDVIAERRGVVVVSKDRNGQASFSSVYREDVPLRPREHLLGYIVSRRRDGSPEIRFSATRLRTSKKDFRPETAAYAVVSADDRGHAVLTGLADAGGKILVRTEAHPAFRRK